MSNVEGMNSACRELLCRTVYFKIRLSNAKPPFDILRFDILRFAFPWFCCFSEDSNYT